ncbi:hypothetical protein BJX65DRAFT_277595 [Aspergillus insuetus]
MEICRVSADVIMAWIRLAQLCCQSNHHMAETGVISTLMISLNGVENSSEPLA